MEFWINKDDKQVFMLPIPPKSFSIKKGTKINTFYVGNIGEIGVIGKGLLADIEISSFFPNQKYHFQKGVFYEPQYYLDTLEKMRDERKPIRLTITETPVNSLFMIVNFEYGIQDGTKDVYFTLTLKEYRPINVVTVTSTSTTSVNKVTIDTVRPVTKVNPKTYKVVYGDTLWGLSKRFYGDGSKYMTLFNKNKDILKNPNTLYVGQVLKI